MKQIKFKKTQHQNVSESLYTFNLNKNKENQTMFRMMESFEEEKKEFMGT